MFGNTHNLKSKIPTKFPNRVKTYNDVQWNISVTLGPVIGHTFWTDKEITLHTCKCYLSYLPHPINTVKSGSILIYALSNSSPS